MANNSNIEWTDATWSPITGCTRVSAGCDHCYSAALSKRLAAMGQKKYQGIVGNGHFNGVVKTWDEELTQPLRWKKPKMIFVNSMSDTFHKSVPFEFIDKVFAVMALCPQHQFQVLTKRPDNAANYITSIGRHSLIDDAIIEIHSDQETTDYRISNRLPVHPLQVAENVRFRKWWPLPNVWVATSVENQATADERIPPLLRCPAAVRFLSAEPLLGAITFRDNWLNVTSEGQWMNNVECGHGLVRWVIIGCESGPHRRQMQIEWAADIIEQCRSAGVSVFVKQLPVNGRVSHDPSEWPEWARVRQFPAQQPATA